MKVRFLPVLSVLLCSPSVLAQSPFPLPIPTRPTLPLPVPTRPTNAGFLYLNVAGSVTPGASSGPSYFAVPPSLSPSLQGNIVAASISLEPASGTVTGGWALTAGGQIGGLVANLGGAPGGGSPSSPAIVAPISDAAVVAGNVSVTGWWSSPVALVAIKSDGEVVGAQGSAMLDVPAEAQGLRTLGFFSTQELFYGLKQSGQFVAWSYASSWPSVTATIATTWTDGKPELVQAEMVSSSVGDCLIGLTTEGRVRVWNAQGIEITTPAELTDAVLFRSSNSSASGTFVAVLQQDGSVVNFAIGQSQTLPVPATVNNAVNVGFIGFTADLAVALLRDGSVRAWKTQDGSELPVPEQIGSIAVMGRNGFLRRADGAAWRLSFGQTGPMEPGTVLVQAMQTGVLDFDSNYAISRDPSLILGFSLPVLARLVAEEILSHSNNYGLATKPDLLSAVEDAVTRTQSQIQASPNAYNLFSAEQHAANYNNGIAAGTSLVTANPSSYNLYTSNSIMDLRMNGLMVQKQGSNAVVTFQTQTTTDLTQPFTNNGTPITAEVPMPGNKGFIRINAEPAASPNPN